MNEASTISKIQSQVRSPHRYNVYLDDEYAFSVAEEVLIRFSLLKGKELTEAEIAQVQQAEAAQTVRSKAYHYLSFRPRTRQELLRYLAGKGYEQALVEDVVTELESQGWVDEQKFADQFIAEKMRKGYGALYISQDLAQRGLDSSVIQEALREVPQGEWREAALRLLHKKAASYRQLSNWERVRKMGQLLQRRGYPAQQAYEWIKEYLADEDGRIDFPSFEA